MDLLIRPMKCPGRTCLIGGYLNRYPTLTEGPRGSCQQIGVILSLKGFKFKLQDHVGCENKHKGPMEP